jgi:cytoskeletal protein CcmA (bactofilin family)
MSGSITNRSVGTCAWLLLVAMFAFLVPATSHAAEVRKGNRVEIDANEVVDDSLIALAETVIIDGHVTGDALVFANAVEVTGTIDGNLVTAAERVEIEGFVGGSVLTAGQDVYVGALQGSQLYAVGRAVTLDAVELSGDAMLAGSRVDIAGSVGRDVYAKGQRVEIEAELQRDLVISGDDLYVGPQASVGRDLEVHVDDADDLDVAAGAMVYGSTEVFDDLDDSRFDNIGFYTRKILMLVAGLVFGLVAFTLAPNMFQAPRDQTEQHRWTRAFGLGLASLFLIPIAALIVAVTLIGLPLALFTIGGYALALYLGKLFIAAEIGRRLLRLGGQTRSEVAWSLLLGLLLVAVLVELPFVGALLSFLLAVFGLGTVINSLLEWNRRRKGQVAG